MNYIMAAILALVFYISMYLPVEYIITEMLLLGKEIFPSANLVILLAFTLISSQINWRKMFKTKSSKKILFIIIIISGTIFAIYRKNKLLREYWPKIYQVTPNSGIQGQIIEIKGSNFHPVWQKGKVIVGNQEAKILEWDDDLITIQQPVPARFGQVDLYVIRNDNNESNRIIFEVKDPKEI